MRVKDLPGMREATQKGFSLEAFHDDGASAEYVDDMGIILTVTQSTNGYGGKDVAYALKYAHSKLLLNNAGELAYGPSFSNALADMRKAVTTLKSSVQTYATTRCGEEYRNIKTGDTYVRLGVVVNATNGLDGKAMILYSKKGTDELFVRDTAEFDAKFERVK